MRRGPSKAAPVLCSSDRPVWKLYSAGAPPGPLRPAVCLRAQVPAREADEIFASIDTDGSGEIDAKELSVAFYAARLAGGVDIYVPLNKSAALGTAAFKHKMLHGWRSCGGA